MTSIARIEEHAVVAWPSTHAEQGGGWLLRHTPGVGKRRNNSALPSGPVVATVAAPEPAVTIEPRLSAAWRAAYGNEAVSEHVLQRIGAATGFASITVDAGVAALGLFVVAGRLSGVFCMATAPEHRRQGLAAAILRAGAAWSAERGADMLYLQVEDDNEEARGLYRKVGFTRSHSYHYRVLSMEESS
jgi:ribosomal protein S18 acetylase RimI-like enzyme